MMKNPQGMRIGSIYRAKEAFNLWDSPGHYTNNNGTFSQMVRGELFLLIAVGIPTVKEQWLQVFVMGVSLGWIWVPFFPIPTGNGKQKRTLGHNDYFEEITEDVIL